MGPGPGSGLLGPTLSDPEQLSGPLHGLQIAVPRFSPDGKQIAFIGGLMSDQGSTGGDIYLIPTTGLKRGEPKDVTPNRPSSPAYIAWLDDHDIGISEHVGGSSRITALDLTTGKDVPGLDFTFPETIIAGDRRDERLRRQPLAQHRPHPPVLRPPARGLGRPHPTTSSRSPTSTTPSSPPGARPNPSTTPTKASTSRAGCSTPRRTTTTIQRRNIPSSSASTAARRAPSRRAGPARPTAPFPSPRSATSSSMPNPRGSFGQGEKFTQANVKDFGYGDLRDILAGVDLLEKRFPIDKRPRGHHRLELRRLHDHVRRHPDHALPSRRRRRGHRQLAELLRRELHRPVDDPVLRRDRLRRSRPSTPKSSPINFIKNVKTPTLMRGGRPRRRVSRAAELRVLARAARPRASRPSSWSIPTKATTSSDPTISATCSHARIDWFQAQMPPSSGALASAFHRLPVSSNPRRLFASRVRSFYTGVCGTSVCGVTVQLCFRLDGEV